VQEQVRRAGGAAVAIGVRERARDGDRAAAVIAEAPCDPPRLSNAVCGEEREIWRRGRVDPNVSRATRIEALWNVHDRDVHTVSLQATGGISAAGVDDDELDLFFLLEERANRRDQRRFIAVAEDRASKLCLHREDPKSRATGLSPVQRRSRTTAPVRAPRGITAAALVAVAAPGVAATGGDGVAAEEQTTFDVVLTNAREQKTRRSKVHLKHGDLPMPASGGCPTTNLGSTTTTSTTGTTQTTTTATTTTTS